jgi:hypothetical protein
MTTTTARPTAPAGTIARPARIGTLGGALWALLPVAWAVASVDDVEFGTLPFVAVAASYWLFAVLPPLLIVVGVTALRRALGADAGRLGSTGLVVLASGMATMSVGVGIEVASISFGGGEVALGHALLLIGFLVSVLGGILTGVPVLRRRPDVLSRIAGVLLVVAFPLGLGIGLLGSAVDPENDAWFWAAITVPMGLAWVLLGRSLAGAHRSPSA